MSNKLAATYSLSGQPTYFRIWSNIQIWNGAAFVNYVTANYATYVITAAELGTASRRYIATMPPTITSGVYYVELCLRLGGSPAETDPVIAAGDITWNGVNIVVLGSTSGSGTVSTLAATSPLTGTHYFLIWDGGNIWSGTAFVTYVTANYATYAIAATQLGVASRRYNAAVPAVSPNRYYVELRTQPGGGPAETDQVVASGDDLLQGPAFIPGIAAYRTWVSPVPTDPAPKPLIKNTDELEPFNFDFTLRDEIVAGAVIQSVKVITTGRDNDLIVGPISFTSKIAQVQLSGGSFGTTYTVHCQVTLSTADIISLSGELTMQF